MATAIGDFAEGVPFEEWPHWKQYAVPPPGPDTVTALRAEETIPEAVNALSRALFDLNAAFTSMARSLGVADAEPPWRGSLDSLAGRQLKWVYPQNADDEEFLKRATLLSTFIIDGLEPPSLRKLLTILGGNLHLNEASPPAPLGSRNLLQRVTLVAVLVADLRPEMAAVPALVKQAQGNAPGAEADLQAELARLYGRVREKFAPLAFLYDLRIHGGLAHPPNKAQASEAAALLDLPRQNWHRENYLRLLSLVTESIRRIAADLEAAALRNPNQWATGTR